MSLGVEESPESELVKSGIDTAGNSTLPCRLLAVAVEEDLAL